MHTHRAYGSCKVHVAQVLNCSRKDCINWRKSIQTMWRSAMNGIQNLHEWNTLINLLTKISCPQKWTKLNRLQKRSTSLILGKCAVTLKWNGNVRLLFSLQACLWTLNTNDLASKNTTHHARCFSLFAEEKKNYIWCKILIWIHFISE